MVQNRNRGNEGARIRKRGEGMKHPKDCNGCRAFWQSQCRYYCDLGYELKFTRERAYKGMDVIKVKPKNGECPKPLTLGQLVNAKIVH